MIIKSMSRKEASFGQLLGYIDRERDQEAFTIRQNLYGRDRDSIRAEFEANAKLLQKRKNGVYLFHEIVSLSRAEGLSPEAQKERLHEITREYLAARCPENLVYGGLHQDKDHSYHMHLCISANRAGDHKRQRLSKYQFRDIQVQLEAHVLRQYPELEQKLAIGKRAEGRRSQAEEELHRRTGERPRREELLDRLREAYGQSQDADSLRASFEAAGFELYVRGKNLGVIDQQTGKKHRLKTLDLQLADQVELRLSGQEAGVQDRDHEAEREAEAQAEREAETARQAETEDTARQSQRTRQEGARQRSGQRDDPAGEKEKEREKARARKGERQQQEATRERASQKGTERPQRREERQRQGSGPEKHTQRSEGQKQGPERSETQEAWQKTLDEFRQMQRDREAQEQSQAHRRGRQGRGGQSR